MPINNHYIVIFVKNGVIVLAMAWMKLPTKNMTIEIKILIYSTNQISTAFTAQ